MRLNITLYFGVSKTPPKSLVELAERLASRGLWFILARGRKRTVAPLRYPSMLSIGRHTGLMPCVVLRLHFRGGQRSAFRICQRFHPRENTYANRVAGRVNLLSCPLIILLINIAQIVTLRIVRTNQPGCCILARGRIAAATAHNR